MPQNKLRGLRFYESGPMDFAPDGGVTWRNDMTLFLRNLGVIVLDPCNKPIENGNENVLERNERRLLKASGQYDQLSMHTKKMRVTDLRLVDVSDAIIAHINLEIPMCGTMEEIFLANRQKKPIILHCEQGKSNINDWFFGTLPHEMMFSTWNEVKDYLLKVDSGEDTRTFNRWMFFDMSKIMPNPYMDSTEYLDMMEQMKKFSPTDYYDSL